MSATVKQSSETEKFSKSVAGSIKSLLNSGGRTYFILEHKTRNEKHKVGESREFIGDYVELGRGDSYAVNFGNDCSTVSRPHAAIVRKDNGWVIQPLSQTNPTLVNRQRVAKEWHLHNGDEIQLSTNGPIISFLTPANNKVGTMGMTLRMKAVVNEAIKPYKNIIAGFVALLLILVGSSVYIFHRQNGEMATLRDNLAKLQGQLSQKMASLQKAPEHQPAPPSNTSSSTSAVPIQRLYPNIFFIVSSKISFTINGEEQEKDYQISATGFLLKDGTFVTARHVVEPWLYGSEPVDSVLNIIASNGGKVKLSFSAFSSDGDKMEFTTNDFTENKSEDTQDTLSVDGKTLLFTKANPGGVDWAITKTSNDKKGLMVNKSLSKSLNASTELYILGFPFAIGANSRNDIKPIFSTCIVSRDGLDGGTIITTKGFDHGNSGGPVFAKNAQGDYEVVGIVSAGQGSVGFICPISAIH